LINEIDLDTEKIRYLFKNCAEDEDLEVFFDKICSKLHGVNSQKCKPACAFHQVYPLIYEKNICECGAEFVIARNDLQYRISIDVSKIKRKHVTDVSFLFEYHIENIQNYLRHSLVKLSIGTISNFISQSLNLNQLNHECSTPLVKSLKLQKTEQKLLFLSFNWSNLQRDSIDSLYALSVLKSSLDLSSIFNGTVKTNFNISSILLENNQKQTLLVTSKDHKWSFHYNSKIISIKSGNSADLLIFIIRHNLYPVLVCYDASATGYIKWSPSLISFLEFTCLSKEVYQTFDHYLMFIEQHYKSFSIDNINQECKSCKFTSNIGEKCPNCDFIHGDWICENCGENNEEKYWECWSCKRNRVVFQNNFECQECYKVSISTNYCRYCPERICFICGEEVMGFEKAYCEVCSGYDRSFDHNSDHTLTHYKCIN
jgi:hypothetical protein